SRAASGRLARDGASPRNYPLGFCSCRSRPPTRSTRSSGRRRRTSPTSCAPASRSWCSSSPRITRCAATRRRRWSCSTGSGTPRPRRPRARRCAATSPAGRRFRAPRRLTSRCRAGDELVRRGVRAGALRRARPQRGHGRDQARARDGGQALGLDAERQRAGAAHAGQGVRAADAGGLVDRRRLLAGLNPRAGQLHARRRLEGRARGARALPRRRVGPAQDPRQRRLGGGRRDRRARALPEPRGDALVRARPNAGGTTRRARRRRGRGHLPLLARGRDGVRPHADRRRRLLLAGLMEPTDSNLRAWEEAHKRIRRSSARGSRTLPKPVRERLPDIGGRHVLHLACGAGRETAALMSLGALVTGVDSSEETVKAARKRLPDAALVTASPETLPVELRRKRFDVVYQSWGALAEIQDLAAWADGIASALKKGGILFLYDEHP